MRNLKWKKIAYKCRMAEKQSGFTLVELLVSIAIFSIVSAAIFGFIVVGSRNYTTASTEINLQQEAQLALNQMSDVIIDTTRSVNYYGYPGEGSGGTAALKDADFSFEPAFKSLLLFNGEEKEEPDGTKTVVPGSGNDKNYQFYWDKADEELYFSEIEVTETDFSSAEKVLLAQHVREFSADLSQVEEKRIVQVTMTFANGNKEYTTTNNITIRNKVLVNDFEVPPIDKKVELKIVPKEPLVILEPGETYHFSTPKVSGKNVMDKSVTWSIEPGYVGTSHFTDEQNGIIAISNAETSASFQVRVTTNAVDSNGAHASALVIVKIKRANSVDLSKTSDDESSNGANEVSAGKGFTISANVDGIELGTNCSGCSDATTEDKYVVGAGSAYASTYGWKVTEGASLVTMNTNDHGCATFTVSSSAKKGDKITIQATSLLSVRKGYATPVQGIIELTVKESKPDISFDGEIRYGRATKIGIDNPDFNKGGQGYYVVCARIKTDPNASKDTDKVMLYGTNGTDTWLTPDLFGLLLDKNYYISIQLLDPGKHLDQSTIGDLVKDYNNNLDGSGTYIGTKYVSSSKLTFELYPPQIGITYNSKTYIGEPVKVDPIYALAGGTNVYCRVTGISNAREEIMDNIRFKVYSGEGTSPSEWNYVYGCEDGNNYSGNSRIGGLNFEPIKNVKDLHIALDGNNATQAIGSYHYVPYLKYTNAPPADHTYEVYSTNYSPDYSEHFYDRSNSTISFEIKGGNLNDIWVYTDNRFRKGDMYFPLPSESAFEVYFDKDSLLNDGSHKQQAKKTDNFAFVQKGGNSKTMAFKVMTCKYVPTEKKYVLELFYQYTNLNWNNTGFLCSAGTFTCEENGTEWKRQTFGKFDGYFAPDIVETDGRNEISSGGTVNVVNLSINMTTTISGEAYIPVPMEDNFSSLLGLTRKTSAQTVTNKSIRIKNISNNNYVDVSCPELRCYYDEEKDLYTLERYYFDNSGNAVLAGKFTCYSYSTEWTQIP